MPLGLRTTEFSVPSLPNRTELTLMFRASNAPVEKIATSNFLFRRIVLDASPGNANVIGTENAETR